MRRLLWFSVMAVAVLALCEAASANVCSCPTVQLVERRTCSPGNGCFAEYGVYGCNSEEAKGCEKCVTTQNKCCNVTPYQSATEGEQCTGGPGGGGAAMDIRLLLRERSVQEAEVLVPTCKGGYASLNDAAGFTHDSHGSGGK